MLNPQRSSRLLDFSLLAGGLLVGLVFAFLLRTDWAKAEGGGWVWIPFLAGAGLAGYGLKRIDRWLPRAALTARPAGEIGGVRKKMGLACLAASLLITLWIALRLWPNYFDWAGTPNPWIIAMLLVLAGGILLSSPEAGKNQPEAESEGPAAPADPLHLPRWLEIVLFLAIAALAVYLRLHRLGEIPTGIYVDETNGALDALKILEGSGASPFGTGWYGTPNGYIFYMAGLFKALGASYWTLKAASLIPAILTVWAVYPLGRLLFGSLGGLSAMLLLAVSRWHLSMSRWGWNETAPLLFQILATFFLLRGLRDRRSSDFAIGGLISGLMMYTYLSSRLALATLGVFGLVYLLLDKAGPLRSLKKNWGGLVLFILAFGIAFAPLAVTHITDPFTFNNRVQQISIFKDVSSSGSIQPLLMNIRDHLRFFHQIGDHQGKHNLPNEPQTDPFTGLFFVVGLAYGLWRPRDWRYWLLWLWILFGLAGGVFSSNHESPQSYRTLTVVPAIALLAGDVMSRLGRSTGVLIQHNGPERLQKYYRQAGALLLCVFLGASGVWETSIYFGRQAESLEYQAGFNLVENGVAREAVSALNSGMGLYLSPRFYDFSPLRFLAYVAVKEENGQNTLDQRPWHLFRPEQDLPLMSTGSDALILLDVYYLPVMDNFLHYYPNAAIEVIKWKDDLPLYIRVQVSRDDLSALQGLDVRYTRRDGSEDTRRARTIEEHWEGRGYTSAEWNGQIKVDNSGEYDFTGPEALTVIVDGEAWREPRFLCTGLHNFKAVADQASQGETHLGWVTPIGNEEIISAQAFFRTPDDEQGLTTYYYDNPSWEGLPICRRSTPFLLLAWPDQEPIPGPFSATFKGYLRIEKGGVYTLRINADDGVRLTLDGIVLAEGLVPDQPNDVRVDIDLKPGDHPIQIDYFQQGGGSALEFYWRTPEGGDTPVPSEALIPERGEP